MASCLEYTLRQRTPGLDKRGENQMRYSMLLMLFVGTLVLPAAAADNPPGSYQQTCRDIKMRGDTLRAKCETRSGQWVRTQLNDADRCVGDITNIDGQLTCNQNNTAPE